MLLKYLDIKPQPTSKLEDHKQWMNRMRAELIRHMGKKITVKESI